MRLRPRLRDPPRRDQRTYADQGEQIMLSYFYAWTPLVIVGTLVLLAAPWLGVIALLVVAIAALAAFALAFVYVPYVVVRAVGRHLHRRGEASPRTAPALSPATNPGVLGDDL